jgi:Ino eighty subunit 2
MDTINRLLRKQPPKRRGRGAVADADGTPADQEGQEPEKADPTMVRWVSNANGCKLNVPEEWLGTPAGRVFGAPPAVTGTSKLVQEL